MHVAGGVEIAGLAELFGTARVVAQFGIVETELHVARKGDGAALADFLLDPLAECVHSPFSAALGAVLRRADKHFDEVVVQGVVELALEAPFKLLVVEVAGMKIEIIGVHGERMGP